MSSALLLRNARFVTLDPPGSPVPAAAALLIEHGRIAAVGAEAEVRAAAGSRYDDFDCGGALAVPAFIDAHVHLLSFAASLAAVDCSPPAVRSIPELLERIRGRANTVPAGRWIRATGYRETELVERRHPTRWELDAAAPHNPVRLIHGSGHGCVLNSAALQAAGITNETDEPAGAYIGRRTEDGEIDGLLLEMNEIIDTRTPRASWTELSSGVVEACKHLLSAGITSVHDLGVQNDRETMRLFQKLRAEGALTVDLAPALGFRAFEADRTGAGGTQPAAESAQEKPWTGMVKMVINELDGEPSPGVDALAMQVRSIHAAGARACIHAVSARACEVAAEAFERVLVGFPVIRGHRLEHAALCPPAIAARLARLGIIVAANPGFLYADGDRYLREIPIEVQPYLHNPGALHAAGVRVAFGSDAPVSTPAPLRAIAAAVQRTSGTGRRLPGALMPPQAALAAHTSSAAFAGGSEDTRGRLAPGLVADLILLPPDMMQEPSGRERPLKVMRDGAWVA